MKRFIKTKNHKGFTLVETLLATFILVVTSTMLVNGFVATMGYSYQTSVYSKSGANNGDNGREATAQSDVVATGTGKTLTFSNSTGLPSVDSLNVGIEKNSSLDGTVPGTLAGEDYAPKDDDLIDNRTAFYYFPEYCQDGTNASTKGKILVLVDYDTTPYTYYWVVDAGTKYVKVGDATKTWNK